MSKEEKESPVVAKAPVQRVTLVKVKNLTQGHLTLNPGVHGERIVLDAGEDHIFKGVEEYKPFEKCVVALRGAGFAEVLINNEVPQSEKGSKDLASHFAKAGEEKKANQIAKDKVAKEEAAEKAALLKQQEEDAAVAQAEAKAKQEEEEAKADAEAAKDKKAKAKK